MCETEKTLAQIRSSIKMWQENNKYTKDPYLIEKERARGRKYYHEHKEEISLKRKGYYLNNKEKMLLQANNYYKEHKEEISKKKKEYYIKKKLAKEIKSEQ